MEKTSLDLLKQAIAYRGAISSFPPELKAHCLQYEEQLIQDISDKTGFSREAILHEVVPSMKSIGKILAPLIIRGIVYYMKKRWASSTATAVVSAAASYYLSH